MLFERRLQRGLIDGSIRVAFRRWKRLQVVAGRRYRSPIGLVEIDSVSLVEGDISPDDARAAGYASVAQLLADLTDSPAGGNLYRLELRRSDVADPRDELAHSADLDDAAFEQVRRKLERLDQGRPWTIATLRAIEAQPGTRAGDLAAALGWSELLEFKLHVRKLKALGLTISLRIGYRLAPRGEALLAALRAATRRSVTRL